MPEYYFDTHGLAAVPIPRQHCSYLIRNTQPGAGGVFAPQIRLEDFPLQETYVRVDISCGRYVTVPANLTYLALQGVLLAAVNEGRLASHCLVEVKFGQQEGDGLSIVTPIRTAQAIQPFPNPPALSPPPPSPPPPPPSPPRRSRSSLGNPNLSQTHLALPICQGEVLDYSDPQNPDPSS